MESNPSPGRFVVSMSLFSDDPHQDNADQDNPDQDNPDQDESDQGKAAFPDEDEIMFH